MSNLDQWLIVESEQECMELIQRFKKSFANKDVIEKVGVPLQLENGQWAQCVEGFSRILSSKEKKKIVSLKSFQGKIVVR